MTFDLRPSKFYIPAGFIRNLQLQTPCKIYTMSGWMSGPWGFGTTCRTRTLGPDKFTTMSGKMSRKFVTNIKKACYPPVAKHSRRDRALGFFRPHVEFQRDPCNFMATPKRCAHTRTWPNEIEMHLDASIGVVGYMGWDRRRYPARPARARRTTATPSSHFHTHRSG